MSGWFLVASLSGYLVIVAHPSGAGWTEEACERSAAQWPDVQVMAPICLPAESVANMLKDAARRR